MGQAAGDNPIAVHSTVGSNQATVKVFEIGIYVFFVEL
jgi:hypothetical protein